MNNPIPFLEVGVKVFISNTEGKYLILKRAIPYPGETFVRWDIPGGRINPGEQLLQALQREVAEETQLKINVEIARVLSAQDIIRVNKKHTVRITYVASIEDYEQITINPREHTEYRWVTLNELKSTKHDRYLLPIIPLLDTTETLPREK